MNSKSAYNLTQPIAYMGLHMQLPEDWQPIRHSLSPARGSLVFVDRRRQCMELGWKRLDKKPDLEHMLDDYELQIRSEHAEARFKGLSIDDQRWQAVVRLDQESGDVLLIRAVCFDAATSTLLEATLVGDRLPGPAEHAINFAEHLLVQIRVVENGQTARRWRMFDLDVEMPEHWRLTSVTAEVAHACFGFTRFKPPSNDKAKAAPTRDQCFVRRYGMASVMYRGDLQRFVERRHKGMIIQERRAHRHQGHEAATTKGIEPGKRMKRYLGQLRRQRDLVFRIPKENAMYHVTTLTLGQETSIQAQDIVIRPKSQTVSFLDERLASLVGPVPEDVAS